VAATREFTEGRGADVVLDIMGAKYLGRNVDVLNADGRLATIGMQGGSRGELDLGKLMRTRGSISATTLRARPVDDKARIVKGVRERVWPLVEAGAVLPIIDTAMPMSQAREAHRRMEASDHIGKILLLP
jgi:NADPH:quinone reductase-like Zn-dependent oxidoreductase